MDSHTLYIIAGASGSGKTTLLQNVVFTQNLCDAASKYSTRKRRPDILIDGKTVVDDVSHLSLKNIEKRCDILYEINAYKYGINSLEIIQALGKGKNLIVILSDMRAIKILKKIVEDSGNIVKVIYLLSRMDSASEFTKTWSQRIIEECGKNNKITSEVRATDQKIPRIIHAFLDSHTSDDGSSFGNIEQVKRLCDDLVGALPQNSTYEKRSERIRLMFNQYIHNIGLFDYVILNTTSLDDMFTQAKKIIDYNNNAQNQRLAKSKLMKGPVVFIVCASPKSGKATLMENLNIMGSSQIQITPKYADREAKSTDKRDGTIVGRRDLFLQGSGTTPTDGVWEWSFHKIGKSDEGTQYAVKLADIIQRLTEGISQIFVSNHEQIDRIYKEPALQKTLRKVEPRFVYLYLHRVRTDAEIKEQAADETRRLEISRIHQWYVENIEKIDHVLVNPNHLTYSEDLHDQMMSLIELYHN